MLVALNALQAELAAPLSREQAVTLLPMLGFPIDGAEEKDGTVVLDVDITANRGDMMSHRGVARDLAAKLGAALKPLDHAPLTEGAPALAIRLDSKACGLYATALLALGKGTTPEATKAFLASLGASAKGLAAVDASNELLHRYGHPTHAFDADKLKGGLTVRLAKAGETLLTLDGVERKLTGEDLLIADESGPIALAGLMGGESTKVTEATTRVLLESAYFDPRTVRLMARRHGLHTDASARFGRGADPAMAVVARDLLAARLQAWCGATVEAAWTVGALPGSPEPIGVCETMVGRMAGEAIAASEIAEILQRLGCATEIKGDHVFAVPPTWRHDLTISEDLAEEVLRLRGYDRLPEALPPVQSEPEPLSADYLKRQRLARRLANLGFHQTVTYGFVSEQADMIYSGTKAFREEAEDSREERTIGNPLGSDFSVMRSCLLSSLSKVAEHNFNQGQREVRLFEIAPVYHSEHLSDEKPTWALALFWGGVTGGNDAFTKAAPVDLHHVSGVLLDLGYANPVHMIPGVVNGSGKKIGYGMEVLVEDVAGSFGENQRIIPRFQSFSRYPKVQRDLSLLIPGGIFYAGLQAGIRGALEGQAPLVDVRCVDIYTGKGLEPGTQAWLIRLDFQADRTLTSDEVDGWVKAAITAAEGLGAKLRG